MQKLATKLRTACMQVSSFTRVDTVKAISLTLSLDIYISLHSSSITLSIACSYSLARQLQQRKRERERERERAEGSCMQYVCMYDQVEELLWNKLEIRWIKLKKEKERRKLLKVAVVRSQRRVHFGTSKNGVVKDEEEDLSGNIQSTTTYIKNTFLYIMSVPAQLRTHARVPSYVHTKFPNLGA